MKVMLQNRVWKQGLDFNYATKFEQEKGLCDDKWITTCITDVPYIVSFKEVEREVRAFLKSVFEGKTKNGYCGYDDICITQNAMTKLCEFAVTTSNEELSEILFREVTNDEE